MCEDKWGTFLFAAREGRMPVLLFVPRTLRQGNDDDDHKELLYHKVYEHMLQQCKLNVGMPAKDRRRRTPRKRPMEHVTIPVKRTRKTLRSKRALVRVYEMTKRPRLMAVKRSRLADVRPGLTTTTKRPRLMAKRDRVDDLPPQEGKRARRDWKRRVAESESNGKRQKHDFGE